MPSNSKRRKRKGRGRGKKKAKRALPRSLVTLKAKAHRKVRKGNLKRKRKRKIKKIRRIGCRLITRIGI
jgi:hypothetical protein